MLRRQSISPRGAGRSYALGLALAASACAEPAPTSMDAAAPAAATVRFDLSGQLDAPERFFDSPLPSDLRLTADGEPDLSGFPGGRPTVDDLLAVAQDRPGWPTIPVAYFRFDAPIASVGEPGGFASFEPSTSEPVWLLDVDPDSPQRGRLLATVAATLAADRYTGDGLLSVAAHPGLVLHPDRTYAFVVRRSLSDARGEPLGVHPDLGRLAAGQAPAGAWGPDALALYAPLWETVDELGVDRAEIAAATVFTTGDVVAELRDLTDRVLDARSVQIEGLALDPDDGAGHERYCELLGTVRMPQFQRGTPPFDTEGRFEIGADGLPIEQRQEVVPLVVTIPRSPMPDGGYPLMLYLHGSGGVPAQLPDRGPTPAGGEAAPGTGPARMIAPHGFAAAASALPLSPARLEGASAIEYLNFTNLAAFVGTFRQGVIEQRLLLRALSSLRIDPARLEGCDGPSLPAGVSSYRFDPDAVVALGQSMGGMYVNMLGAVEPQLRALVPAGAGGFWSFFILETNLIAGVRTLLGSLLRADGERLSHLHPAMHLLEMAWEPAEPVVYMPRLSRRPLPGVSPRPIYEPVGQGDSYFPTGLYDAVALAYGHPQAGEIVWPSMQESLEVGGLEGLREYPVFDNLTSADGAPYTGVVVQSAGNGHTDPHEIFVQIPDIQHQWTCFLHTEVSTGTAVVPAPAPIGTPCTRAE